MKVKEVEIFNQLYQESGVTMPSPKDVVTAYLINNGDNVKVNINKDIPVGYIRRLSFHFNVVDMELQTVSPLEILTTTQTVASEIDFNIEKVRKTLIKASSSVVTVNYDITIFTYEANINTTYGSKRLSYPYTASVSENTGFPISTDGWYSLLVTDVPLWNINTPYVVGDVLYHESTNAFVKCLIANTGDGPETVVTNWTSMTDENWSVYATSTNSLSVNDAILRICSEFLLTRNIKQSFIFPCIQATSFKEYNDKMAMTALTKITAMREAAVAYLESGDPIKAVDTINTIPFEYHTMFGPDKTTVISSNNFTI